jgi:hypothetical protein
MGKATITANQGKGLYTATIGRKTDRIKSRLQEINSELAKIGTEILANQAIILLNEGAIQAAMSGLTYIANNQELKWEEKEKLMDAASRSIAGFIAKVEGAQRQINMLKAKKAALLDEKERLEKEIEEETIDIWCCDYSNRLTGDVGTIEVTTNADKPIIVPGHPKGTLAVYDYNKHGILDPLYNAGVPNSLTAFCMEPGWRKWKPFYRIGTLTAKTANTGDVDLESAWAEANRNLNTNQTSTLSNVPIEYMGIGGALFRVGDRVVVKFNNKDWAQPRIIGFADHPRPPGWYESFGPAYHTFNNNAAGVAGKLIPSGNGMPVSGQMVYSGTFYEWATQYQYQNAANVDMWDGSWLQSGGNPVYWVSSKAFITQDFHKIVVMMNSWGSHRLPATAYNGSGGLNLGNYPEYTDWTANAILFPGDAVDFLVNDQAVGTSDFLLADASWNTLEITVELGDETYLDGTWKTNVSMFLYTNLQSVDTRFLSGTDIRSVDYLFAVPDSYNPVGTLVDFGFNYWDNPPSLPYGYGEYQGFVAMYNWDRGYWSNALDAPYTFNGSGYWPKATAGLRYFRYFRPESKNGNIWTFVVRKPDINPEHDIKAIHFAGKGIVHSVRFYLDE